MESRLTPSTKSQLNRADLLKGLGKLVGGIVLFVALIKSVTVAVAWSRGDLVPLEAIDGLWIVLLPLWIGLYMRYYSVLRADCDACRLPDERPAGRTQR